MRCPNCDRWVSEDRFLSACDCGEQDYEGGGRCPHCGACVPDSEWQADDADAAADSGSA